MMKILFVSLHPHLNLEASTGYGMHMRGMIDGFRKQGCEVKTFIQGGETRAETVSTGTSSTAKGRLKSFVPNRMWLMLKDLNYRKLSQTQEKQLIEICQTFQPDVIYERSYSHFDAASVVAQKLKIPHAVEVNAPFEEERAQMEGGNSLYAARAFEYEKSILSAAKVLFPVSTALKQHLTYKFNLSDSKMIVNPNACPAIPDLKPAEAIRSQYRIPNEHKIIGFSGSIFPYHGVEDLLRVFATLKYPESTLMIVGDGASVPELKTLAKTLKVADRVCFTGAVPKDEIYNYINAFDIAVMAQSNWYGSPIKLFEYAALGKQMVAPDVGPVREVFEDIAYLADDTKDLQNGLHKLLHTDWVDAENLAQFSRENTWEKRAETVLKSLNG